MTRTIELLVLNPLTEAHQAEIARVCSATFAETPEARALALQDKGPTFTAVLTIGTIGLSREQMLAMPALELICCMGAGYEGVDMDAARSLGITVANGRGTNDQCVADHAMGMVIATLRNFRKLDQLCREGIWRTAIPQPPNVSGKRMGIFGLGMVGEKIARRAEAFDMEIGYHNRSQKAGVAYRYFDSLPSLAQWCDVLVCAAPGGEATRHSVDAAVLAKLGADGYLINVGRGSLVDTQVLGRALRDGVIAGAGLDVYESEPLPPAALLDLDNLLITPHLAGWSPEATQAQLDLFLANLEGHFSGRGVATPV